MSHNGRKSLDSHYNNSQNRQNRHHGYKISNSATTLTTDTIGRVPQGCRCEYPKSKIKSFEKIRHCFLFSSIATFIFAPLKSIRKAPTGVSHPFPAAAWSQKVNLSRLCFTTGIEIKVSRSIKATSFSFLLLRNRRLPPFQPRRKKN